MKKAFVDADSITPMALLTRQKAEICLAAVMTRLFADFMTQVGATQAAGLVTEDGRPTRQLGPYTKRDLCQGI